MNSIKVCPQEAQIDSCAKSTAQKFLISVALQNYEAIQGYIEEQGFHPDTRYENKPTAVCYACLKKDLCLIKYLVRHGADIHFTDERGMSPLHYAVLGGCEFCIKYLIHSGAEVNALNIDGETPLALVIRKNQPDKIKKVLTRMGGYLIHNEPKFGYLAS